MRTMLESVKKMKSRPYLKLGQRMAEFRDHMGWNQETAAEKTGVSLSVLKDIERGVKEGRLQTRLDLLKAYQRTLGDLYAEASETQTPPKAPFPSREFFRTLIEDPDNVTLAQAMRLIEEMKAGGMARRAMILGLAFRNFEIAEPYLPADSPKLRALLKAL